SCTRSRFEQIHRIGAPSHPSCHLNLAQLGSLLSFKPLCNKAVLEQFLVIAIVITMLKLKKPMIQNK
ncbi:hypothetical protein, partial [Acinetobacter baumannii]|uniref:hypothetical protein n=1 Tax=Acinetobacter baumannii TaxID=470 RepID=UPI001C0691EB